MATDMMALLSLAPIPGTTVGMGDCKNLDERGKLAIGTETKIAMEKACSISFSASGAMGESYQNSQPLQPS